MSDPLSDENKLNQIISYLKSLDSRVSRIESQLNLEPENESEEFKLPPLIPNNISERADILENEIGQFWFAKVGIVILSIGFIFLLTFPYQNLPSSFPSLIGFILVCILFSLSYRWRNSIQFISQYMFGAGLLLLYFTVLRLHFFSTSPAIQNELVENVLLIIVTGIHLFLSYKKKSVYLNSLGITLGCLTALISNNNFSVLIMLIILSVLTVHLKLKFNWNGFFVYGIILIHFTFLIWFINNPILGNKIEPQNLPLISVISILVLMSIFSLGNLLLPNAEREDSADVIGSIVNCFLGYTLFLIITLVKFKTALPEIHFLASTVFISISILFWLKHKNKYSTFFYSILGYTALSAAIIAQFPKPDFFVWLCWQSLVVISTALWFRSKIIILANFIMYLLIFFSYLFIAGAIGLISLSFGVVALISARILNWQKHRLDLKTEKMRLAYLGAAFFIFPYALYHIVPKDYVALSWTVVAIIYYVISIILKNKKYRWMSLFTFLLTVIYILFVGTTNVDPIYRIISFIVLGIVLLGISIFYGRIKSKSILKIN